MNVSIAVVPTAKGPKVNVVFWLGVGLAKLLVIEVEV